VRKGRPDGTFGAPAWVDLPVAGPPTYTHDALAGGTHGGAYRAKRAAPPPGRLADIGYNQVFDALYRAYEERLAPEAVETLAAHGWVDRAAHPYDCPADARLLVEHVLVPTPPAPLRVLRDRAPVALAIFFSLGFLGAALALGIFRRRKGMPTDIQEAIEFAQSKGRARREGTTGVTFDMVAGADATLDEVRFVVDFLKDPAAYAASGAVPPKGILLEGGPGTGKTLIAKAVAGEAGVPFYQMPGSEFVEAIVGVGAARVRDLFKRARVQNEPCIVFVDEIDAVGTRRAEGDRRPNEEREQTLNQLLSELDGFAPGSGVVFIAATNRSDLLDPALLRPGRFDRRITVGLPDARGRLAVLKVHAAKRPLSPAVDLQQLALDTPGLSGAELANVINEAALCTARRGGDAVDQADVDLALDRILFGLRRAPLPDRLKPRLHMAAHEAGVAIVSEALRRDAAAAGHPPRNEAVERVSIAPRGDSWSRTVLARGVEADYFAVTRGRLRARLAVLLAGHAAEAELCPDGASTYAVQTAALARARTLATRAVGEYGLLSPGVKPPPAYAPVVGSGVAVVVTSKYQTAALSLDTDAFQGVPPRGAGFQSPDPDSDAQRRAAWALVRGAWARARRVVRENGAAAVALRDALLEREDVSGDEVRALMAAHPPAERAKRRRTVVESV
jgi:ATP-dependent metalloprotease FtsH